MPYMAVQCSSCNIMQVKEVRKSSSSKSKWSCKICNEKQSMRKVYCEAATAKDVRKFVQNFNLTMGQAEEAKDSAKLEAESPPDYSPADGCYREDEEDGQIKHTLGRPEYHTGQIKSSNKWDDFLSADEEQGSSSEDEMYQSSDAIQITTTLPDPSSRRRTRPSSSSPPPKRPVRDPATSRDSSEPGGSISSDSTKLATHPSKRDYSGKFHQENEYGFKDSEARGNSNWERSTATESPPSSLPISSPAQEPRVQTSKWSEYLT